MKFKNLYTILLHFTLLHFVVAEFFSALTAGVAAVAAGLYYTGKCTVSECCHEKHIPGDFNKLKLLLDGKLYGQHIAKNILINAIKHHWKGDHIQKPLTLSLHGLPGTGKNYVARFIQESLYSLGTDSRFVHHFMGRIHFPLADEVPRYQRELYGWIKGNVTLCDRQLFIFDEVDKMPPKLLDIIKPMIDYNQRVEKIDYRKSIFIFLSNTGSKAITDAYLEFWRNGVRREDIKLKDFENLITQGAFNEAGGFYRSDNIKSNLIDHYVPFLPMELEHVRKCIIEEFRIRNVTASERQIGEVLDYVQWGPSPENVFSNTGCKRLSQKVAVIAAAGDEY